jgi:hypothetical protein
MPGKIDQLQPGPHELPPSIPAAHTASTEISLPPIRNQQASAVVRYGHGADGRYSLAAVGRRSLGQPTQNTCKRLVNDADARRYVCFGSKQTYAVQKGMSALAPIATAKADSLKRSCPLYPQKRTCAVRLGMSAKGQKRTHAVHQRGSLFDPSSDLTTCSNTARRVEPPSVRWTPFVSAGDQPQPRRYVEGAHQQIHQRHSAHRR